jgi:hypothetical protein
MILCSLNAAVTVVGKDHIRPLVYAITCLIISRNLFAEILRLIAELRPRPNAAPA